MEPVYNRNLYKMKNYYFAHHNRNRLCFCVQKFNAVYNGYMHKTKNDYILDSTELGFTSVQQFNEFN